MLFRSAVLGRRRLGFRLERRLGGAQAFEPGLLVDHPCRHLVAAPMKCATCPGGTRSCTDGGRSHTWSTSQARKVLLMQPKESRLHPRVEKKSVTQTGS